MSAYTEIPKIIAETGELPPKVLGDLNSRYPSTTQTSVEYFVAPSPLGNDANDGSEDYPLATLAAAIERLPDIIRAGHAYTITLLPGEWDEELNISNLLVYGELHVRGSSEDRSRHKVRRFRWDSVIGYATISDITTTLKTASGASLWFTRCAPHIAVSNVEAESDPSAEKGVTGVIGLLADYGSQVHVRDSDFGGKRYGIRSNYLSRVFSHSNTGKGNTFGVGARWGGILSLYGTQPEGDTNVTNDSGGLVVNTQGGKVGLERHEPETTGSDEKFLIDRWELGEGNYVRKKWAFRSGAGYLSAQEIPPGSRLRLYFRNTEPTNLYIIEAQISYLPSSSFTPRSVRTAFFTRVTQTNETTEKRIIASHFGSGNDPDEMLQMGHTGASGIFYLDLVPGSADNGSRSGWYGMDVDISNMRNGNGPVLFDAQIVG